MIQVACVFDDGYAPHFAALAASIAASRGSEPITIHALHDERLGAQVIDRMSAFLAKLGLDWRTHALSDADRARVPSGGTFHRSIWYRMFLPDLLDAPRVLYLDVDTLALQSLEPLFRCELGEHLLAAVAQPVSQHDALGSHVAELGIDASRGYFNSGVLLMNLEAMRRTGFADEVLRAGHAAAGRSVWPDQDALNLVAAGRWLPVHPKWNALADLWFGSTGRAVHSALVLEEARHSPAILHFAGTVDVKPWHYRSLHPLTGLYRAYRAQTPWPLERLEGRTLTAAVLRRLPRSWQYAIAGGRRTLMAAFGTRRESR